MNPGAAEEAGKAAGLFMSIMKDQPLALALVFMNVLLLALFFYVVKVSGDNQREVHQLLSKCVVPEHRT